MTVREMSYTCEACEPKGGLLVHVVEGDDLDPAGLCEVCGCEVDRLLVTETVRRLR